MRSMNRIMRISFQQCKRNYKGILLTVVAICTGNVIYLNYMRNIIYSSLELSAADALFLSWMPFFKCILLVPLYLFFLLKMTQYDFQINRVIRYQNMKQVWRVQICSNTIVNIWMTAMLTGGIVVTGCRMSTVWVNFNERFSLFSFLNDGKTVDNPSFAHVVLLFGLGLFLYLEVLGSLFLLFQWYVPNRFLVYLAVYVWNLVELYTMKRAVVFGMGIEYGRWDEQKFYFMPAILLLFVIWTAGAKVIARKELPDEKK